MQRAAWQTLTVLALTLSWAGCSSSPQGGQVSPDYGPPAENTDKVRNAEVTVPDQTAGLPKGAMLFQPQFLWADATVSREGTGFFVETPEQRIAAVTNVQHLRAEPLNVREASWLGVRSDEPVITFTRTWGRPGDGGSINPTDLREDYLLLPATRSRLPKGTAVLQLDQRPRPEQGERVWLPVKNVKATHGYRAFAGEVESVEPTHITVSLDQSLRLASLNGSPIISQRTGKVIGSLSRGGQGVMGRTLLVLTPAKALRDAIESAQSTPPLTESFATQAQREAPSDGNAG